MAFQQIKERYGFEESEGYIQIITDFEVVKIYCGNPEKYTTSENELIRFIDEELLEDYPCIDDIHGVYFLPTHKTKEFIHSLDNEEILPELKCYYSDEMKFTFKQGFAPFKNISAISHKARGEVGTSFYRADAASVEELIEAGKQILKLNAMKGYKIAIGEIPENIGLFERSNKERSTTPKSRHYSFWKFDYDLTELNYFHVAKGFAIYSEEEVYSK